MTLAAVITATQTRLRLLQNTIQPIAAAERQKRNPASTLTQFNRSLNASGFLEGEFRLRCIFEDLDTMFPDGKYELQKRLHSQVIRASLRQILGKEYKSSVKRICAQYGWEDPQQNAFIIASRRAGKTTGMASAVASILLNVPGMKIVNFSGAKESAAEFVKLVAYYAEMISRGKQSRSVKGTKEKTTIKHGSMLESYVIAYPSGGKAYNVSLFFVFLYTERPTLSETQTG